MSLTKAELAEHSFGKSGLNKCEAKDMVELFFGDINEMLEKSEPVKHSGFGNFGLRNKDCRPGRNSKTGEAFPITSRHVVTFKRAAN